MTTIYDSTGKERATVVVGSGSVRRFERVNEKTELYNDYSAKGVNIK